jgi:hypothetical protein
MGPIHQTLEDGAFLPFAPTLSSSLHPLFNPLPFRAVWKRRLPPSLPLPLLANNLSWKPDHGKEPVVCEKMGLIDLIDYVV